MEKHFIVAAVAATCLAASSPAQAQMAHAETTDAAAPVTLQQWSDRIQESLDKTLQYPVLAGGQPFAHGTVEVKFNCSESGRPDKVTLAKTSGSSALDRAAVAAVSKIVTLHPLPSGIGHDQQYRALVVFDNDETRYRRQVTAMHGRAGEANKWFKGPSTTAMRDSPVQVAGR